MRISYRRPVLGGGADTRSGVRPSPFSYPSSRASQRLPQQGGQDARYFGRGQEVGLGTPQRSGEAARGRSGRA